GRHDNFFELGGHSLLAVQLISRLRDALGLAPSLDQLFTQPTLAGFAAGLDRTAGQDLQPIPRRPQDGSPAVLSFAQQRLWFLTQLDERISAAYHIAGGVRLRGVLNETALQAALNRVLARHDSLRTRMATVQGQAVAVIAPQATLNLVRQDLRGAADAEQQLQALADAEAAAPFDLAQGPLIRGRLLRLADDEQVLLLTMHHIMSDGWSMAVLINELSALYAAFDRGLPDPLPALAIGYADYAHWQRQRLDGPLLQQQLAFWTGHLQGAPALLSLPTDRPRPPVQSTEGASLSFALDADLSAGLKALAQRHGCTLFMTLLGAWAVLLSRLSAQTDVVVGTPVANRSRAELEPLIGLFVNTLALRVRLDETPTVGALLAQVRQTLLAAQAHQDLPFEQVVEALQPSRSLAHSAVFQSMFAWQNTPQGDLTLPGLQMSPVTAERHTAQFDLELAMFETGEQLVGSLTYAQALFDSSTIARWADCWQTLLRGMVAGDALRVDQLPVLPPAQAMQLQAFNATAQAVPAGLCIQQLFERQVAAQPDALAVRFQHQQLSYAQLNARANSLARQLQALGVQPGRRVALLLPRGVDMLVAVLAVLKAGGAYVPMDAMQPRQRLERLLADSQPVLLLSVRALQLQLPQTTPALLWLDDAPSQDWPTHDLPVASLGLTPEHPAYVIYTSGSTGQPKGVVVGHAQVINLWAGLEQGIYRAHPQCRHIGLNAALHFDASVQQWVQLLSGRSLSILPDAVRLDPAALLDFLADEGIQGLDCTPSQLELMVQAGLLAPQRHGTRLVLVGGEAIRPELWQRLAAATHMRFVNVYGPTECTVDATFGEVLPGQAPHIGKPLGNVQIHILDGRLQPQPLGVPGEICIAGAGLAQAYLNQPELTQQAFVTHAVGNAPAVRLYKTGDLGRWLPDGRLEYLGRHDFQVKIRGFRIELGEIESRLASCPGVDDVVVLARTPAGHDAAQLVAYIRGQATVAQLREHARTSLPAYMVPAAFVVLAQWPLNANGKLDRQALPAPAPEAYAQQGYAAPQGEVEQALATLCAELLGVPQVGRHDNFFELGGHSLLAVSLIERMRQAGLHTDVQALFTASSLAELAQAVGGESRAVAVPPNLIPADAAEIRPEMLTLVTLSQQEIDLIVAQVPGGAANVQDIYPLAPLQEGILFHHLMAEQGDPYLLPSLYGFANREAVERFVQTVQAVIDRHDILRTAVLWQGLAQPVQVVQRQSTLHVERLALDPADGDIAAQLQARFNPSHQRLDLARAPLLRAHVAHDAAGGRWLLHLLAHHLISDHTTLALLAEEAELIKQGRQAELPAPVAFRQFVAQARLGVSQAEHEAFFRQMLGDVDEPTAPFGLLQPPVAAGGAEAPDTLDEAELTLPPGQAQAVRRLARQFGVSAASLMHMAWGLVLARSTGRQDVVFGTVLFGRMQGGEQADRVLGLFINTLPLRVALQGQPVQDALRHTHTALARLLRHEHAPLSLAQRCSGVAAPTPLF
ncbi:MAG TPA: amino acid adenylation domain-containing protein, partial [Aquabacterium sp.]|nr:amino acid adenylation domain-containing protein [Aquabacterium sp.]